MDATDAYAALTSGAPPAGGSTRTPRVSIIIKAYNEEAKIARAIESALAAGAGLDAEIIVADSLSTDATVAIARRYPVRVVQLAHAADRGCGAAAQLGYQHSRGDYVYVLDGDMELEPDFLRKALDALTADPSLGGVAGLMRDTRLLNHFDRHRARLKSSAIPGRPTQLDGGGLYRRTAIEQVGYLSNRNLPAFEEAELGLRLTAGGWRLERLDEPATKHTGHDENTYAMLRRHWRTGYAMAGGMLLRTAVSQPWLWRAAWQRRHHLAVIGWWALFGVALGLLPWSVWPVLGLTAVLIGVVLALLARKKSLSEAAFSFFHWHYSAAALLIGLTRAQLPATEPIPSRVVAEPGGRP